MTTLLLAVIAVSCAANAVIGVLELRLERDRVRRHAIRREEIRFLERLMDES